MDDVVGADDAPANDDASAAIEPTGRPPTLPDRPKVGAAVAAPPVLDDSASRSTLRSPTARCGMCPRPRGVRAAIPCPKPADAIDRKPRAPTAPSPPDSQPLPRCVPPTWRDPSESRPRVLLRVPSVTSAAVVSARQRAGVRTPADRTAAAPVGRATRPTVEAGRTPAPVEVVCPRYATPWARPTRCAVPRADAPEEPASPVARISPPNRPTGRLATPPRMPPPEPKPLPLPLPPTLLARCARFPPNVRPAGTAADPVDEARVRLPRTARANAAGEDERNARRSCGGAAPAEDSAAPGGTADDVGVCVPRPATPPAARARPVDEGEATEFGASR